MEDYNSIFLNVAHKLQNDAAYWNQVGSQISPGRPIQVDNEGNLTKSRWDFGWRAQRTPSDTINLFGSRLLKSTNQTLDDLSNTYALLRKVSYSGNEKAYQVALRALIQLDEGVKASLISLDALQKDPSFEEDEDAMKIINQGKILLEQIQPNIRGLKTVLLVRQEEFEKEEFELLPEKEELDLITPHLTWESSLIASPDGFAAPDIDSEKLKKDVRKTILHFKEMVPLVEGSNIMVPDNFENDIHRNGRLTVNGVGYIRDPRNLEKVSDQSAIEIHQEMVKLLGEKGAQRLAPLLQQEIAGTLNEKVFFEIFTGRFPTDMGTVNIDVNVDDYNVNITAQILFYPQFSEGKPIEDEPKEFVLCKKTLVFPRSDLEAEDFETNPLPNLHVMDQFTPIINDRERAIEMLFHPKYNETFSESVDQESHKRDVIAFIKKSSQELEPIAKGSELLVSHEFVVDLHRIGGLTINEESFIPIKSPFRSYDESSDLSDQEKIKIYQRMVDLLGEEGAKKAASLIHQGIAGTFLDDIQPRAAELNEGIIPAPIGGIFVDLQVDGENLRMTVKTVTVFNKLSAENDFEWHDCVVGKKEIVIPLEELNDPDLDERENPLPGLHVVQSFSIRVRDDKDQALALLRRF